MKLLIAAIFSALTLIASAAPHRKHLPRRQRPARAMEVVRKVPWQTVAAGGVAVGTIIAAYKISDGVEDGLKTVAEEKPETFTESLSVLTWPLRWAVLIALLCSGYFIWRRIKKYINLKGYKNEDHQK